MAAFDFKTATPSSASSSALILGAESQSASTPSIYNTTGSGTVVLNTSATLVTPTIGVATATSINKVAITAPASSATLTIANGKTLTCSNTLTFTGTDSSSVAFGTGGTVLYSGGALGTPSSGTLTNCTGLPVSTGISGLGTGVATAAASAVNTNGGLLTASTAAITSGAIPIGAGSGTALTGSANLTWSSPALTIGAQQTTQGSLVLANTAAGAYATTIKSSNSASAAWTLTLPTTAGTNLYVLQTDGSGNTSWVAQSGGGGSPGGSNTQLQYNNSGSFAGASGLTTDGTHLSLGTTSLLKTTNTSGSHINLQWGYANYGIGDDGNGNSLFYWAGTIYGKAGAGGFYVGSTSSFQFNNGNADTGSTDLMLSRGSAGILNLRGSSSTSPGAVNFYTYAASPPSAPSASQAIIYADTSGGKIRLMALFPSGAAQQIAIEP